MNKGKSGMGSKKHGISGGTTKSPRLRLMEKIEAEKKERKAKVFPMFPSLKDLFKK